jgi:hypothetical protein
MFGTKMQSAKCKSQNEGKDTMAYGYPSILHFAICILQFTLAAARCRTMHGGCDES